MGHFSAKDIERQGLIEYMRCNVSSTTEYSLGSDSFRNDLIKEFTRRYYGIQVSNDINGKREQKINEIKKILNGNRRGKILIAIHDGLHDKNGIIDFYRQKLSEYKIVVPEISFRSNGTFNVTNNNGLDEYTQVLIVTYNRNHEPFADYGDGDREWRQSIHQNDDDRHTGYEELYKFFNDSEFSLAIMEAGSLDDAEQLFTCVCADNVTAIDDFKSKCKFDYLLDDDDFKLSHKDI